MSKRPKNISISSLKILDCLFLSIIPVQRKKYNTNYIAINELVTSKINEKHNFNVFSNNGQSSSILCNILLQHIVYNVVYHIILYTIKYEGNRENIEILTNDVQNKRQIYIQVQQQHQQ